MVAESVGSRERGEYAILRARTDCRESLPFNKKIPQPNDTPNIWLRLPAQMNYICNRVNKIWISQTFLYAERRTWNECGGFVLRINKQRGGRSDTKSSWPGSLRIICSAKTATHIAILVQSTIAMCISSAFSLLAICKWLLWQGICQQNATGKFCHF